jgi:hypothetical protein
MGALDSANWERHAAAKTYTPATPTPPPPQQSIEKYTVQKGDTLSQIAKDAGISLKELKDLNPKFTSDPKYKNGNMIWSGTKVNLPGQPIAPVVEEKKSEPIIDGGGNDFSGYSGFVFVNPTPPLPPPPPPPTTVKIKTATPENILWDPTLMPVEILTDLIFEDIGGQELLSLIRHDTVSGDSVSNQLIKNLTFLNQEYSSKNILGLQNTSDKYFSNFSIKLDSKIPVNGSGPSGSNIYVDSTTQDVAIELVNLEIDERLEVQISIGGTIYSITLGVIES